MNEFGSSVVAALAIAMMAYSARGQWQYLTPAEASRGDLRAVPDWLRPVVTHHGWFKYGGGFAAWLSIVLIIVTKGRSEVLTGVFFAFCSLSGAVYGLALSWRWVAMTNKYRINAARRRRGPR